MNVTIKNLKEIAKLSKKDRNQLRKLNPERAYNGRELTKYELIYQIVFLHDAPKKKCDMNKMKAEQHHPSFFSGFEQEQNHFDNSEQLLNIEWIKSFAKHDNFYRFSISRDKCKTSDMPHHTLMAEYKNGFEWWVVAFIRNEDISGIDDLPEWKAKYKNEASAT